MSAARGCEAQAPPEVRAALVDLFAAALAALDPERLLRQVLRRRGADLLLCPPAAARATLPLDRGLVVVGAGKGAAVLAHALEATLGAAVVGGVVIVPPGHACRLVRLEVAIGSHPLPDRRSVAATRRLLAVLDRHPAAAVLVLLTGGASSLLVAPAPGLTLADKRRTCALLLASGADIAAVNAVRKHLSAVKGGRLAERLAGRPAAALVVSDVPGDDPTVIGSGPTVADPTTFGDACTILAAHAILSRVPASVRRRLARGSRGGVGETPKDAPGMPTLLLAGNGTARAGLAAAARRWGYAGVENARRPLSGATRAAAQAFAARIVRRQRVVSGLLPAVVVAGGETTVDLGRRAGRGGRNQEFALEVARALAGRPGWALLSAGTDGIDGPTDAAGAFADGATIGRAERLGLSVPRALDRHDVYPLLRGLGQLHTTGPTGTNVADLVIALAWKGSGWRLPAPVLHRRGLPRDAGLMRFRRPDPIVHA